jgi:hypothetical protein
MQAFTVSAAARLCGVDRRTLQRAIQAGRLPLDTQHCLSREALIAAGYLDAMTPQSTPHGTPQDTPRGAPQFTPQEESLFAPRIMPQDTPQELMQATALLALLERLTTAITDLHEEVCSLREDLRQMPQRTPRGRRRRAPTARPEPRPDRRTAHGRGHPNAVWPAMATQLCPPSPKDVWVLTAMAHYGLLRRVERGWYVVA